VVLSPRWGGLLPDLMRSDPALVQAQALGEVGQRFAATA